MKRLAIVGPDGAGKTTWIRENVDLPRFHAIPLTSKLPFKRDTAWRLFHEFLMGIERAIRYMYLRISNKDFILDRCIIDAEVYAIKWANDMGTHLGLWISRFFDLVGYWPDMVVQLVPSAGKAKPKRGYSDKEIIEMNMMYHNVLRLYGYKIVKKEMYLFGEVVTWSKTTSSLLIAERSLT